MDTESLHVVSDAVLGRFLAEFPLVRRVQFRFRDFNDRSQGLDMMRTWRGHPRVRIDPPGNLEPCMYSDDFGVAED